MVDMGGILTLQGQLFLLVLLGVFLRRFLLGEQFQKGLTDLILDLILPCNIFTSFRLELGSGLARQGVLIFVMSILVQAGCWLLAAFLFRRCPSDKKSIMQYGTLCSNAGFLGTPIAEGLFGQQGVLLTSIYLVPQRIMMWTVGVTYFTKAEKKNLKKLLNPSLIAIALGLLRILLGIPLPKVLEQTVQCLGMCNTGLSMLLIGMLISDFQPRDFVDPMILYYSAVRLVLVPLLVFAAARVLHADPLCSGISVILSAMPAGVTSALLAEKHHGNARFAAGCMTVSTVFSLVAIPLWCIIL